MFSQDPVVYLHKSCVCSTVTLGQLSFLSTRLDSSPHAATSLNVGDKHYCSSLDKVKALHARAEAPAQSPHELFCQFCGGRQGYTPVYLKYGLCSSRSQMADYRLVSLQRCLLARGSMEAERGRATGSVADDSLL